MDLGARLRRARLEAGLSQRQLCGTIITRNMLSLIENGTSLPSIPTLLALAERLGKPVGYFFGESGVPERPSGLERVWEALEAGQPARAEQLLDSAEGAESREKKSLRVRVLLDLARKAAEDDRKPYAVSLLKRAGEDAALFPELDRCRLLLLGQLQEEERPEIVSRLPSLDRELMLRAEAACAQKNFSRAARLLEAAEDQQSPEWNLLRGRIWMAEKQYDRAAPCFLRAEPSSPMECARCLEICYREMEDYRQAYFYACRQKKSGESEENQ